MPNGGLEGRHAHPRSVTNTSKGFSFRRPAQPQFRLRKIRRIGDHVNQGLPIGTMALGALAHKEHFPPGDRLPRIGNRVLQFLEIGGIGSLRLRFVLSFANLVALSNNDALEKSDNGKHGG